MENTCKKLSRTLGKIGRGLENIFIPPVCVHCGSRRFGQQPVCFACSRVLRRSMLRHAVTAPAWDGQVHAMFRLTPTLQSLIHGFKYNHYRRHLRFLSACLPWSPVLDSEFAGGALLIPVPLHSARRRERGYNQSAVFAAALAATFADRRPGFSLVEQALFRIRPTPSQTHLKEALRARNLYRAFRADPAIVSGRDVLLVDDICTTGNTLRFCREALIQAGASRVEAFVLAWVERKDRLRL